jgi:AraC-like DNA-binding protein
MVCFNNPMLRYLAYGSKDFTFSPVLVMSRFNWEFYANLNGRLRPTDGQREPTAFTSQPTLWAFPPDRPHGWESQGEVERVVFHFSSVPDVIREACAERGFLSVPLQPGDVAQMRELGHALETHYRSPTPASLLLFDRALIDLSLIFLRGKDFDAALPLETVAVERVERVIEWYLSHLHERPTLEALAEVVHVSPAHLRRQFQVVYGQSPHLVLTHLRLEKAAQLLANTGDTLDVIAKRSGFNSASDLCRVFRRRFKAYPNEWRTQVSGKEKPNEQIRRLIARVDPEASALAERRKKRPAAAGPGRDRARPK